MEKNHITGFILLFATLFLWTYLSAPDEAEMKERKRLQDSTITAERVMDSLKTAQINGAPATTTPTAAKSVVSDSMQAVMNASVYGPFAVSSVGAEKDYILENETLKVVFSNKGGKPKSVTLKQHTKSVDERKSELKDREIPVILLGDERNKFEYLLPIATAPSGFVSTEDLFFEAEQQGKSITFTAKTATGGAFIQKYTITDEYALDYSVDYSGLQNILYSKAKNIEFNWENYLQSYEKNNDFERQYSAVYYKKTSDSSPDDCGCMSDDKEELKEDKIDWVSHSNQYFNSSLIAVSTPFSSGLLESVAPDGDTPDHMEKLSTNLTLPLSSPRFDMKMYLGPNEYEKLQKFDVALEDIVPFGSSIFGTINRYMIRPIFNLFSGWLGSLGLAIVLMIFILKMLLYPLMYKMLKSQALMGALKPEIEKLTSKYKDEPQKKQMETMKIYQEYGVSPLGGCMPMLIQMPIWYALFRFFPASFLFRQESFLWANDLSSYDDVFHLGFNIPLVGDHLSLFTILYSVSMLLYTYYNTKHMDMSANPAMKYMQYLMPVMFFGFFNKYASALTCYMFFSNVINILQTVITKQFVFNDDKLKEELAVKKAKPKKTGGFQAKLQEALKQQQAAQAQKNKK